MRARRRGVGVGATGLDRCPDRVQHTSKLCVRSPFRLGIDLIIDRQGIRGLTHGSSEGGQRPICQTVLDFIGMHPIGLIPTRNQVKLT